MQICVSHGIPAKSKTLGIPPISLPPWSILKSPPSDSDVSKVLRITKLRLSHTSCSTWHKLRNGDSPIKGLELCQGTHLVFSQWTRISRYKIITIVTISNLQPLQCTHFSSNACWLKSLPRGEVLGKVLLQRSSIGKYWSEDFLLQKNWLLKENMMLFMAVCITH